MLHQDKQKSLPGVNNTKLYETANRRDILQRINKIPSSLMATENAV